jgi:zeaxanthin glucosyltransferase
MLQLPDLRQRVEREGLEFLPMGEGEAATGEVAAAIEQLGKLTGLKAIRFTIQCASRLAGLTLQHAPNILEAAGIDMALVDQNEPAGGTSAEHLKIPFVSVAHLPINREPSVPPPFVPRAYVDNPFARVRNRIGYSIADLMTAPLTSVLNRQRRKWGLPVLRTPDDSFSKLAQICTLPEAYDFPRRQLPGCFHYVGPFIDSARPAVDFPWSALDGRPLVYASFGTLQNGLADAFQVVASACARLDVQLVISSGGSNLTAQRWQGNPIVVNFAPQLELLRRSSLFITHAGLNSVLESLSSAVPMVAIPVTNDQPAVAARLERCGAGEVVPIRRLSEDRLRAAIAQVLSNDTYRVSAARLQAAIRDSGGVRRAADIIEALL